MLIFVIFGLVFATLIVEYNLLEYIFNSVGDLWGRIIRNNFTLLYSESIVSSFIGFGLFGLILDIPPFVIAFIMIEVWQFGEELVRVVMSSEDSSDSMKILYTTSKQHLHNNFVFFKDLFTIMKGFIKYLFLGRDEIVYSYDSDNRETSSDSSSSGGSGSEREGLNSSELVIQVTGLSHPLCRQHVQTDKTALLNCKVVQSDATTFIDTDDKGTEDEDSVLDLYDKNTFVNQRTRLMKSSGNGMRKRLTVMLNDF